MSLKNKDNDIFPWNYQIGDENFQKATCILNKGKKNITIEKSLYNKGFFYSQKNKEKSLSLNSLQPKSTCNQLFDLGYKLRIIQC